MEEENQNLNHLAMSCTNWASPYSILNCLIIKINLCNLFAELLQMKEEICIAKLLNAVK